MPQQESAWARKAAPCKCVTPADAPNRCTTPEQTPTPREPSGGPGPRRRRTRHFRNSPQPGPCQPRASATRRSPLRVRRPQAERQGCRCREGVGAQPDPGAREGADRIRPMVPKDRGDTHCTGYRARRRQIPPSQHHRGRRHGRHVERRSLARADCARTARAPARRAGSRPCGELRVSAAPPQRGTRRQRQHDPRPSPNARPRRTAACRAARRAACPRQTR